MNGQRPNGIRTKWNSGLANKMNNAVFRTTVEPRNNYIELPYDPAIPLLGIYPEKKKTLIRKDRCTAMFTAALCTIAKTWKQSKYLSTTDECIKKVWYTFMNV